MMIQIEVDNETLRTITTAGLRIETVIQILLGTLSDGLDRPGSWEYSWVVQTFGEDFIAQNDLRTNAAAALFTCPTCSRRNFTLALLREHHCPGKTVIGSQMLSPAELLKAVHQAKGVTQIAEENSAIDLAKRGVD
jgi:hypothetical protein